MEDKTLVLNILSGVLSIEVALIHKGEELSLKRVNGAIASIYNHCKELK